MNKPFAQRLSLLLSTLVLLTLFACSNKVNKGVTNKKDFSARNPPSVRIKNEYDKAIKRANRGKRTLKGKEGKALEKAQLKLKNKKMRRDKRYLKRKRRMTKRDR